MKRILIILSAVVLALGLSSCNGKIENPTARNFIGTWDLISTDVVATDGTVTSTPCKSLDYLVIEENTISFYESDKISKHGKFAVKDKVIFFEGNAYFDVESLTRNEMVLNQSGFGLLVKEYRLHYKRR